MAGEIYLFNSALEWEGDGTHDYDTHTFKAALITAVATPAASSPAPCWGAGGTTDFSATECVPGGTYSAGGATLGSVTWVESSGTVTFDSANVTWAQDASNPNNARWMIVYNSSATNKNCVLFVDLGGTTDLSSGAFTFTVPTGGWFSKAVSA